RLCSKNYDLNSRLSEDSMQQVVLFTRSAILLAVGGALACLASNQNLLAQGDSPVTRSAFAAGVGTHRTVVDSETALSFPTPLNQRQKLRLNQAGQRGARSWRR